MLVPNVITCDVCESGDDATYFCVDCKQNFCTMSERTHSRINVAADHKVVPIVYIQPKNKCHKCSEEEALFCCETCNQVLCAECFVKKHNGHQAKPLKERGSSMNELGCLNTTKYYTANPLNTSITTANIISTISVSPECFYNGVLVPLKDDTIWISAETKQCLRLIDRSGNIIKESVKICDSFIMDAKSFGDDMLLTCFHVPKILKLSENGNAVSPFYILPDDHLSLGLCITHAMDVLLCIKTKVIRQDNGTQVLRIGKDGNLIQTIQEEDNGTALFFWPFRLTSLETGEVIVTDHTVPNRLVCVNKEGRRVFTWNCQVTGGGLSLYGITHDTNHIFVTNHQGDNILMLNKDGTGGNHLLDQTIPMPFGIAIDHRGQLLVTCWGGTIYVIDYQHTDVMA